MTAQSQAKGEPNLALVISVNKGILNINPNVLDSSLEEQQKRTPNFGNPKT